MFCLSTAAQGLSEVGPPRGLFCDTRLGMRYGSGILSWKRLVRKQKDVGMRWPFVSNDFAAHDKSCYD